MEDVLFNPDFCDFERGIGLAFPRRSERRAHCAGNLHSAKPDFSSENLPAVNVAWSSLQGAGSEEVRGSPGRGSKVALFPFPFRACPPLFLCREWTGPTEMALPAGSAFW
jgi:hypothetical protein